MIFYFQLYRANYLSHGNGSTGLLVSKPIKLVCCLKNQQSGLLQFYTTLHKAIDIMTDYPSIQNTDLNVQMEVKKRNFKLKGQFYFLVGYHG